MFIGEICNREVVVVDREESVLNAARLMREHHVGSVVVTHKANGERVPLGVLTDRDIAIELVAMAVDPAAVTVGDAMSYELVTLQERDTLLTGLERMRDRGIRRAPVVNEHGGLVGIIAVDDMIELIAEQLLDVVTLMGRGDRRERRQRS